MILSPKKLNLSKFDLLKYLLEERIEYAYDDATEKLVPLMIPQYFRNEVRFQFGLWKLILNQDGTWKLDVHEKDPNNG